MLNFIRAIPFESEAHQSPGGAEQLKRLYPKIVVAKRWYGGRYEVTNTRTRSSFFRADRYPFALWGKEYWRRP